MSDNVHFMKHYKISEQKDKLNQAKYTEMLDKLFDISHANSFQMIKNEEDRQFLLLQQESNTGSIAGVDQKK